VKNRVKELILDEKNLTLMEGKMGIRDIRKKQDELMKLLEEINQKVRNQKDS
jgi:hypothetical protein